MIHSTSMARRHFLQRAGALAALGAGGGTAMLATLPARAQAAGDYKALVCVFLYGGNDGNNMVVPLDSAGYAQYAAVRTAASGIQLEQASLLPIQPASLGTPFGLHPGLSDLQTLFAARKLAVLANVGPLLQPTSKAQYAAGQVPLSLYSHSDQQAQWQSAISNAAAGTGWGGRIADTLAGRNAAGFPVATSFGGSVLFATGKSTSPLTVPVSGSFTLAGFDGNAAPTAARLATLKQLLVAGSGNQLVTAANAVGTQALALSGTMNPILTGSSSIVAPIFAPLSGNGTASALSRVAQTIEGRAATGATRQIFFVALGGFDTHGNQAATQANLFGQLAPALKAFYDATVALGVAHQVTTFTLSDFGRSFQPASGGGTDHAWGNHHFIIGDAVKGGDFHGRFPTLALGGPDDAEQRGRWIPTTSIEQYGSTLARWMGVSDADLPRVFPNLAKFAPATLDFMM